MMYLLPERPEQMGRNKLPRPKPATPAAGGAPVRALPVPPRGPAGGVRSLPYAGKPRDPSTVTYIDVDGQPARRPAARPVGDVRALPVLPSVPWRATPGVARTPQPRQQRPAGGNVFNALLGKRRRGRTSFDLPTLP